MDHLWVIQHSWLIPLMPLLGAAIAGLFGAKWLKGQSHWPIWLGVGFSAVLAFTLLFQMLGMKHEEVTAEKPLQYNKHFYNWIEVGDPGAVSTPDHPQQLTTTAHFVAEAAFFFDPLTAVMLCVICGIGFLITVFAAGYMKGEEGYFRFFAYLGLFIFMMTCLVLGNNLIMLYLGWEGVGLSSYLLIGYYYEKPAAREAAKKAFLVNRIGDFGFGIGIMLCFLVFGTVTYFTDGGQGLLQLAVGSQHPYLKWIPFCLMLGAFGKSAQFPLYVWLPDAMEGPTPVSALIHAATMVTAGVYMIVRCGTLFVQVPAAMTTIAVIGAFTALLAATIALRQFDLKKVFAYSTISQLGFMFVAVGALAPIAGVFHLVTHAFFKALLFLSSGVVMHAMSGELDMRKMSGIKKVLPITNILMLIGCLALAGFPLLSGFFSKDDIVNAAFHANFFLGAVMLFTAFLTAYYTFRLYFRVFWGPLVVPQPPADAHGHDSHGHDDHGHHNHEPLLMIVPLVLLAIGAVLAGYLNWPVEGLGKFLDASPSITLAREAARPFYPAASKPMETLAPNYLLMVVSALIAIGGIFAAYVLHLKSRATGDALVRQFQPLANILEAKYWVDEIYQGLIVEPLRMLGKLLANVFDRFIVDGLVNLAGMIPQAGGIFLKLTVQRGYLQGYASAMLFGVVIILLVIFLH